MWRLATAPSSLLARTLQARYYPSSSVLDANLGTRPSYGWRSLLASQQLMRLGMKKEIGCGDTLNFWHDPWLEDDVPRAPTALSSINKDEWTLSDFKDSLSDQWRIENLQQAIPPDDIKRILQVIPGGEGSQNGYSWIHTNTGEYSVKSGYKLWINRLQLGTLVPEQQPSLSPIYKEIWRTDTSAKIKHFIWRCSVTALAVGTEMQKKRLTRDAMCQVCGNDREDVQHLIFKCPLAKAIWSLSPFSAVVTDTSCSFNGHLFSCMALNDAVSLEYKYLWSWLMWRIWKLRNDLIFQNKAPDLLYGYNTALSEYQEWQRHTHSSEQVQPILPLLIREELRWIPPKPGELKCNTDASWHKDKDRCGIGWILRDNQGQLRFWGAKTYPKLKSPLEAEASSLLWAAKCIWNMGFSNVTFETDSSSTVEAMHEPTRWPRLLTYSSEFQCKKFQVSRVSKERNKAADRLASYAMKQDIYFGTIDNSIPLWLQPFLDANIDTMS